VALVATAVVVAPTSLPVHAASCATGGACTIGDTGPGGGVVFYDAGAPQWWGRWLEARPVRKGRGLPWSVKPTESLFSGADAPRRIIDHKGIGYGAINTDLIVAQSGEGRYAAKYVSDLVLGGKSDWFLPSKDELNEFYNYRATRTGTFAVPDGPAWSSTEA